MGFNSSAWVQQVSRKLISALNSFNKDAGCFQLLQLLWFFFRDADYLHIYSADAEAADVWHESMKMSELTVNRDTTFCSSLTFINTHTAVMLQGCCTRPPAQLYGMSLAWILHKVTLLLYIFDYVFMVVKAEMCSTLKINTLKRFVSANQFI